MVHQNQERYRNASETNTEVHLKQDKWRIALDGTNRGESKRGQTQKCTKKQDKHRSDLKWGEQKSEHKFTRTRSSQQQQKNKKQIQGNNRKYYFTRNSTDTKVHPKWDEYRSAPDRKSIKKRTNSEVHCKQDKDGSDLKCREEKSSLETGQIQKSIKNGINTEVHETPGKHRRMSKRGQTQKCTENQVNGKMHQN